ncbi:MAG TPA: beta-N-acetylhexosaminidase [Anaerolineales bacterium]|nr:beta-N-acetylhexosaminidase [Anaerolineales bacterium]
MNAIIPRPVSVTPAEGTFTLTGQTVLHAPTGGADAKRIAEYLASRLRPATGFPLPVPADPPENGSAGISLELTDADPGLGEEGYELRLGPDGARLSAFRPAGLFYAVQSLLQLFPPAVEAKSTQPGPWTVEAVLVRDQPRFAWRGAMLDVARHFFKPAEVKRFIDQLAGYKFNLLHLHLTDDQGWRLEIRSRPELTRLGSCYSVNRDPGGFYTQAEYLDLVAYARERFITILPEVDMPGHTNAALACYPELNRAGTAPELYTGTEVGFSSFDIHNEATYRFLDEVIGEIAGLTPGPFFHIGGDEAHSTPEDDYVHFVQRVQEIVKAHGKTCIGWEEIAKARLLPETVVQFWWNKEWALKGAKQGRKFVLSPATHAYMDIKYDPDTLLGQDWTKKYIPVREAYEWDPATMLEGVAEASILGIEAPLWSETAVTTADLDYLIFPRLPGYAEIAWTPAKARSWDEYRQRLAAHGPRLQARGIAFYRSPDISWE